MKRVISALIGAPLVVGVLFLAGPGTFLAIVLVLYLMALWEYLRLCGIGGVLLATALAAGGTALGTAASPAGGVLPGLCFLSLPVAALWRVTDLKERFQSLAEAAFGMGYLAFSFLCLLLLHGLPQGPAWAMVVIGAVWAGDTAAFYGGRHFGGRKMAPLLSPKKTWSGAVSGLAGSVAAAVTLAVLLGVSSGVGEAAVIGALVGMIGQVGDLQQSLWKRAKGVKDSGRLIPGHGGLLDRIDSLLLGFPMGYALVRYWVLQ